MMNKREMVSAIQMKFGNKSVRHGVRAMCKKDPFEWELVGSNHISNEFGTVKEISLQEWQEDYIVIGHPMRLHDILAVLGERNYTVRDGKLVTILGDTLNKAQYLEWDLAEEFMGDQKETYVRLLYSLLFTDGDTIRGYFEKNGDSNCGSQEGLCSCSRREDILA